jgi:hypothetical protein
MNVMIDNNWVFGNGAGINFSFGANAFLAHGNTPGSNGLNTEEGCASISDRNGNLLFSTNGKKVWDRQHNEVISDLQLSGHPSATQSAMIISDPGSRGGYLIFTVGADYFPTLAEDRYWINRLMATRIDVVNGVIQTTLHPIASVNEYAWKHTSTYTPAPTERLTAIQHPNCKDYWVLTTIRKRELYLQGTSESSLSTSHQHYEYGTFAGEGIVRIFKVTTNGVSFHADHPIKIGTQAVSISHHGYMKATTNGRRIAIANGLLENVILMDFDPYVGTLSNTRSVGLNRSLIQSQVPEIDSRYDLIVYGAEFAPNTNYLYLSVNTHNYQTIASYGDPKYQLPTNIYGFIVKIDLTNPALPQSIIRAENDSNPNGGYVFGALQRARNGLIYVARDRETSLGAIINSSLSTASYQANALTLSSGSSCMLGLPNMLPNPCGFALS